MPEVSHAVRAVVRLGRPVAAICAATLALAHAGLLNDRLHTSNGAAFIEKHVADPSTEMILYCGGGFRSALAADGGSNPLAMLDAAGPCSLNGNQILTGEDYDAWRHTLERTARKELERSWRVFTASRTASLSATESFTTTNPPGAERIL